MKIGPVYFNSQSKRSSGSPTKEAIVLRLKLAEPILEIGASVGAVLNCGKNGYLINFKIHIFTDKSSGKSFYSRSSNLPWKTEKYSMETYTGTFDLESYAVQIQNLNVDLSRAIFWNALNYEESLVGYDQ